MREKHRRLRNCVYECVFVCGLKFQGLVGIHRADGLLENPTDAQSPDICCVLLQRPLKIPSSTLTTQPQPNTLTLIITCYCPGFWRSSSQFIALERELRIMSCRAVKCWQKQWTYGWTSQKHVQVRIHSKIKKERKKKLSLTKLRFLKMSLLI